MSDYLFGSDVLGAADNAAISDAVQAAVLAEKPLAPARARSLIGFAIDALAEMNFFDLDEDTTAWRDDMAQQLAHMDERIAQSAATALPDKATDVLGTAISSVAEMLDEGAQIYPQILRVQDRFLQSLGASVQVLGGDDEEAFFSEIVGAPVGFDNSQSYAAGSVVYYGERYWRALRDVSPPFLPTLMKGEVPGDSDAWREITAAQAYPGSNVMGDVDDVLGDLAEVLGMFDIGAARHQMDALKPVTVGVALALLRGGQQAIGGAIASAKQPWYKSDLPGDTAREGVKGHLQWHADALAKVAGNPTATYGSGDDLKKWAMQAFIEANAVEEGAAYLNKAWTDMWTEIADNLAKVPREILKLPGRALEVATGIPWWAWYAGGAALVGLVGYGAYRILAGPAGGAVVSHYLGGRR